MERDTEQIAIARKAFSDIAARFPHLKMHEDEGVPVEISISIPVQEGLKQKVWLALQNCDELSFSVGSFQVEWFPCTDPRKVGSYIESVTGFLSGNYRILEYHSRSKCIKAELQKPIDGGWKTVGTWSLLWFPFPWNKTFKEIRNA